MPTECNRDLFGFAPVEGREVVASFDGGAITSDAGALLLGATDRAIGMMGRFAACFHDERRADLIEHEVVTLVGQRVFGIALGYEDLNDHDELRHDPMMAVLAGKLEARREDWAPIAGKSTLNRLELSKLEPTRYHKISHNPVAIKNLMVDLFLEAHERPPKQIILDLDATDDPLHGEQEGRFFHGYYDCYCYLPLYVFCGRHLLVAKLRRADMDAAAGAVEKWLAWSRAFAPAGRARALCCAPTRASRGKTSWLGARPTGSTSCSDWRGTSGWSPKSRPSLIAWPPRAGAPAVRSAASRPSCGRRAGPGAAGAGSSPRPSGRRGKPIRALWSLRSGATRARPSTSTRRSTAPAATWRTGSRSASSTSMRIAPRLPRCAPTNCACGSTRWPMSCCAPCAASASMTQTSRPPPAAPSVSNCSRSGRSCASASVASGSPWHRPVRPPKTGAAPQSGSQSPPWRAPRPHDTRRRGATLARHNPTAHATSEQPEMKTARNRATTLRASRPPAVKFPLPVAKSIGSVRNP